MRLVSFGELAGHAICIVSCNAGDWPKRVTLDAETEWCDKCRQNTTGETLKLKNVGKFVIVINDKNSKEMLKDIYEKGKLTERSGRKATSLNLPCERGIHGRRATMEKGVSIALVLLARNMQSGGHRETSSIFSKEDQKSFPAHYYWTIVPSRWTIYAFLRRERLCGPGYPRLGSIKWGCRL
jgi:hypothetical protein